MDLRAGSPAVERRTWSRSLRGPILAGPSPSCAHDDDRLRFPPVSPASNSKAGKKDSKGPPRDRHGPPCARPSSNSSLDHRRSDARAAENGFAAKSSVNKSAKVVLACSRRKTYALHTFDPPPLTWSALRYFFDIQEDCNGKGAIQA